MPSDKVVQIEIAVNKALVDEFEKLREYLQTYWENEIGEGESIVEVAIRLLGQLEMVWPGR